MIKATFSFIASAHANVLRYAFKKKQAEKLKSLKVAK